jgi:hypothetical protein
MQIRITDTMPGRSTEFRALTITDSRITLRELLRDRVHDEVRRFNDQRLEVYHGLVQPEESERLRNGYRLKRLRELDAEREYERACSAFTSNGFVVFANGRQVHSLDEELNLEAGGEVEFVKLVPLIGG